MENIYRNLCVELVRAWDDDSTDEYEDFGKAAEPIVKQARVALKEDYKNIKEEARNALMRLINQANHLASQDAADASRILEAIDMLTAPDVEHNER